MALSEESIAESAGIDVGVQEAIIEAGLVTMEWGRT
jgi:hypothetical protein